MELVYLWVEEYKNIKEQGFNFSSRFDCKYDKDSNELTIDENKDYVSIFPENINVTAIVGENGSGKSSLLEIIILNKLPPTISLNEKHKYLAIYEINNKLYFDSVFINLLNIPRITSHPFIIHYDYSFTKPEFYSTIKNNTQNIFLLPEKEENLINKRYRNEMENLLLLFNNDIKKFNGNKFFNPDKLFFDFTEIGLLDPIYFRKINDFIKAIIFSKYKVFEKKFILINDFIDDPIKFKFDEHEDYNEVSLTNEWNKYIKEVVVLKNEKTISESIYNEIMRFNNLLENFELFISLLIGDSKFFYDDFVNKYKNFPSSRRRYKWMNKKRELIIDKKTLNTENIKLLINLPESLNFRLFDSHRNKDFFDLSNGEKSLLNIILYLKRSIIQYPNAFFIILIDEAETDLHPNWQKTLLSLFINSFKKNKIHFLLTSHSPFILSDIPKENIIFLEDGVQKHPFKDKQTFGANIHTLLSDGFFMEDGLMGEFAKDKIKEIKKFYELVKRFEEKKFISQNSKFNLNYIFLKQQTKFRHIQSIIGEPFLQTVIRNYLDELEIIFNGKKQFLQDEIKRLQELESSLL